MTSPALRRVARDARALERSRRRLEEGFLLAADAGESFREIGKVAGVSHEHVRYYVKRDRAARLNAALQGSTPRDLEE